MHKHLIWLLPLLLLAACGGSDDDDDNSSTTSAVEARSVRQRTLAHEKAYIPSLYYSELAQQAASEDQVADAKAAFAAYEPVWEDLQNTYQQLSEDAASSQYLQDIGDFLSDAGEAISRAWDGLFDEVEDHVDLSGMYQALDKVRTNLRDWRDENQLAQLTDELTEFHNAMTPLVQRLETVEVLSEVTPERLAEVANDLVDLEKAWATLQAVTPEQLQADYQLSLAKARAVVADIQAQSGNLEGLATALAGVDAETVLDTARRVEPLFTDVLLAFGDFLTPFVEDMAHMEQSYISALLLAEDGDAAALEAALARFEADWRQFADHYATNRDALDWQDYLAAINTALSDAKAAADAAGVTADLSAAYEALQTVRAQLSDLRTYENYPFVTDALTRYHNETAPLAAALETLQQGALPDTEVLAALAKDLPAAVLSLDEVAEAVATMDAALFGFDEAKTGQIETALQAQQDNLQALQQALEAGDSAAVAAAVVQIQPLFREFYQQFGGD